MANGYAIWFSGMPDAEVLPFLDMQRQHMVAELAEKHGADVAAQIAELFVEAVIKSRREIEAGGTVN